MSQVLEALKSPFQRVGSKIQKALFGVNNEKLDFLMDSFYKLDPRRQSIVLASAWGSIAAILLLAVWGYFSAVSQLEDDLNESFAALHELKRQNIEYEKVESAYERLRGDIRKKTQTLEYLGFFESQANRADIKISNLREESIALPSDNPMAQFMSYMDISFKINKISIPKLLSFLSEIEKSGNYFKVRDLAINSIYGENNLYFRVETVIRGYKLNG